MQKTKLLIEPENKKTWRVVARACTSRGLSAETYHLIEANLPNYTTARKKFELTRKVPS